MGVKGARVRPRIAMLVRVNSSPVGASATLQVQDLETMSATPLPRCTFVLSLGLEPGEEQTTHAQGFIHSLDDGRIYPFRSNRVLFDALRAYLDQSGHEEERHASTSS